MQIIASILVYEEMEGRAVAEKDNDTTKHYSMEHSIIGNSSPSIDQILEKVQENELGNCTPSSIVSHISSDMEHPYRNFDSKSVSYNTKRLFHSYSVQIPFDHARISDSSNPNTLISKESSSKLRSTVSFLLSGNNPSFLFLNERKSPYPSIDNTFGSSKIDTPDPLNRSNSLPYSDTRGHGHFLLERSRSLPIIHYHSNFSHPNDSQLILPNKKHMNLHQFYYNTPDWCQHGQFSDPCLEKFRMYFQSNIDLSNLCKLSWHGIPSMFRPLVWKCIVGYLPHSNMTKHQSYLDRKRIEYFQLASSLGIYPERKPGFDPALYRQITIDIPRTSPELNLFKIPFVQTILERVLYCWSIRYPASGYVQGLNDILTPIIFVYLTEHIEWELPSGDDLIVHAERYLLEHIYNIYSTLLQLNLEGSNTWEWIPSMSMLYFPNTKMRITQNQLEQVEADAFWTFLRLLEPIQDNYTTGQCGILKKMDTLSILVNIIDPLLMQHLQNEGIEFFQFAYRWFNCLLLREVPMISAIRIWDTCMSEREKGFSEFFVFLLAAIIRHFSDRLKQLEFQDLLLFLQNLPTMDWYINSFQRISLLCSEAHVLKEFHRNK